MQLNQTFSLNEIRKIFGYFLNAKGIKNKFCKAAYGYRTYDSTWKIFKEKNQIVRHKHIKVLEHGEYTNKLEERIYNIVRNPNAIDMTCVAVRLI